MKRVLTAVIVSALTVWAVAAAECAGKGMLLTGKLKKQGAKCLLTTADGASVEIPSACCGACKCAGEEVKVVGKGEVKVVDGKKCIKLDSVDSVTEIPAVAEPEEKAPQAADEEDQPEE